MKVTGIIAEYNPFHNGHQFHIQKARELTGADYIVVIMSGDYTQRGTPAIFNKYVRAKAALLSGADLILEMPVYGSVASAPDFATCGVNYTELGIKTAKMTATAFINFLLIILFIFILLINKYFLNRFLIVISYFKS